MLDPEFLTSYIVPNTIYVPTGVFPEALLGMSPLKTNQREKHSRVKLKTKLKELDGKPEK